MFLGKHLCELDEEKRFLTPAGFRKHLTSEVTITQGFDQNLWVLSEGAFQKIYKKLGTLNVTDPMARLLFRLILGAATVAGLSKRGQMTIPKDLLGYAQIKDEVLLIGQGDYFEIWSPELWDKQEVELRKAEANATRFSTFDITTW